MAPPRARRAVAPVDRIDTATESTLTGHEYDNEGRAHVTPSV
jgi:hypothetical protein